MKQYCITLRTINHHWYFDTTKPWNIFLTLLQNEKYLWECTNDPETHSLFFSHWALDTSQLIQGNIKCLENCKTAMGHNYWRIPMTDMTIRLWIDSKFNIMLDESDDVSNVFNIRNSNICHSIMELLSDSYKQLVSIPQVMFCLCVFLC